MLDETARLLVHGYSWLPALRRDNGTGVAHTRVMGQRAVGLSGPDAVRFFYDEDHVQRRTAIPGLVQSTLFGHHAVHTLDGAAHRKRKGLFLQAMTRPDVADLVDHTAAAWDDAVTAWRPGQRVVLFDQAARVLTRGVCRWAGVPLADADTAPVARDLTAMVDGFATLGPRHWRARRARARREAWLADVLRRVREGRLETRPGSAVDVVARHRDADGEPLEPRLAAVELLNVVRPTAAVAWFVMFAGHALHRWPEHRERLRGGDRAFAEAFVHELRRFYPFAPFLGGRAVRDLHLRGEAIPRGSLVLLDVFGQNHDGDLWGDPYAFRPQRFLDRPIGAFELIPQGGGDPVTNHRCPGEPATIALLRTLVVRLADADYAVPSQDLTISLRRIPAMVRSRFVITPTEGRTAERTDWSEQAVTPAG
ncbi:cytochrome P450 [Saccharothrix coeruleofusca]|uniref:Fatty-acid peroxygenase n=1 Tax=Saccharothrix coeruleofusca TaxID=33919 RepID=A0A918AU26_9PSEU|nr:cytochrome P450 [Saccharothrix coeruleofusca]GGP87653.1 fatty-acid peroxygenase [Saccharothrix coeruleofusca]